MLTNERREDALLLRQMLAHRCVELLPKRAKCARGRLTLCVICSLSKSSATTLDIVHHLQKALVIRSHASRYAALRAQDREEDRLFRVVVVVDLEMEVIVPVEEILHLPRDRSIKVRRLQQASGLAEIPADWFMRNQIALRASIRGPILEYFGRQSAN